MLQDSLGMRTIHTYVWDTKKVERRARQRKRKKLKKKIEKNERKESKRRNEKINDVLFALFIFRRLQSVGFSLKYVTQAIIDSFI